MKPMSGDRTILRSFTGLVLLAWLLSACQPVRTPTLPAQNPTTPTVVRTPQTEPTPVPTKTILPKTISLPSYLPQALSTKIVIPDGYSIAPGESGTVQVVLTEGPPLSIWIYALVAPFPTIADGITTNQLVNLWRNGTPIIGGPSSLIAEPSTITLFDQIWGTHSTQVSAEAASELLNTAWRSQTTWAIVPFEHIAPRWKVIAVDGHNPLHKEFTYSDYPLSVAFGLQGPTDMVDQLTTCCGVDSNAPILPDTNRRPDRLTTVVLTGVTALVRATAAYMALHGMQYPAENILPWLRGADILHISNEVSFAENCPNPNNWQGLAFCSQTRMIELLDSIGVDVVELSGDHYADWGKEAMLYTLDLYEERGWKTYGGGLNDSAAKAPALFEHNGNRIAFIGCNAKAPGYATAGPNHPGAIHCDWSWLAPAIKDAIAHGYQPIVTFQHEEYYEYIARDPLEEDFRLAAQTGAVIVSGSQGHLPQAMQFEGDRFIHYGLGNLFFDQIHSYESTDKAFIDRHIFYDGAYINTELLTIQFIDYAQSRPMTGEEREWLLRTIFQASGWEIQP